MCIRDRSVALYKCPPGTEVCDEAADGATLLCEERPRHGSGDAIFDERGYIAQRVCLWGDGYGLEPPANLSGGVLGAVKTANATYGHHGEMSWLQMFVIYQ